MKRILLNLLLLSPLFGFGQVSITSLTVPSTQNFDGMGASGTSHVPNWSAVTGPGSTTPGNSLNPSVSSGTSNNGGIYNVGSTSANDRALGTLASGSTAPRFGAGFTNNIGTTVLNVTLSGVMEQWRTGSNSVVETIICEYSINATGINDVTATWVAVSDMDLVEKLTSDNTNGAVDGNLPANRTAIWANISLNLPNSSTFYIRWTDTDNTGSDGMYALDDFSITFYETTLPISLTSFTGKSVDQAVLLNWVTASEKDNKSFEILKSYDGKNFSTLTTVTGAGNSDSEKAYSFTDENPYPGTNYYQLTQTDVNGAVSVAKTISVNSNVKGVKLSAYAAASSVSINISSPNQSNGTLTLYDIAGRKIESKQVALIKGFNEVSFAQSLNKGIYFVNLIADGTTVSLKFVK